MASTSDSAYLGSNPDRTTNFNNNNMKVEDLPQPFQDRIARFNRLFQAGTEDHHDFEHHFDDDGRPGLFQYEMFCIETALAFAELLPTKEAFDTFMDECEKEFKENPPENMNGNLIKIIRKELMKALVFTNL